jgi:hypothetical protein
MDDLRRQGIDRHLTVRDLLASATAGLRGCRLGAPAVSQTDPDKVIFMRIRVTARPCPKAGGRDL